MRHKYVIFDTSGLMDQQFTKEDVIGSLSFCKGVLLDMGEAVAACEIDNITTRLKRAILSVDGQTEKQVINKFVENMLSRDSLALRTKIQEISPDIELKQEVDMGDEMVEVDIPLTIEFFWPSSLT